MKYKQKFVITLILLPLFSVPTAAGMLSVSDINYDSSSEFYGEDMLVVEFQADGSGERLNYTLKPEDINPEIEGSTNQSLYIEVLSQEVWSEYSVKDDNLQKIGDISYVRESFSSEEEALIWAESNCISPRESSPYYRHYSNFRFTASGDWFRDHFINCAIRNHSSPIYNVGMLQSPPDDFFETQWTVIAEGKEPESALLSNAGTEAGSAERIGDHTHIEWVSLRDTGRENPNPTNTLAAYSSQDSWKLVNRQDYYNYREHLRNNVPDNIDEMSTVHRTELGAWKKEKESKFQNLYTKASSEYHGSPISDAERPESYGSNWKDGKFQYYSGRNIAFPDFLIYVDAAEYLQVSKEGGEPKILSDKDISIPQIGSEFTSIDVLNTGNGIGKFEGRITSCSSGFVAQGLSDWKRVSSGETVTFNPLVSFSNSADQELKGNCTFIVEDIESQDSDSITFSVEGMLAEECNPRTQFIEIENGTEVIYECNSDGQSWTEVESCELGEVAKARGSGYECVTQENPLITEEGNCQIQILPTYLSSQMESWDGTIPDIECKVDKWRDFFRNMENAASSWRYPILGAILGGILLYLSAPILKIISVLKGLRN